MKPLLLPVCFAAVAAVAADLKDPAEVARDWNRTIDQTRQPAGQTQNLNGQSDLLTTTPLERAFPVEGTPLPLPAPRRRSDRLPLIDAPNYRIPQNLPNNRPKGAVPWEYNGEVYWLVPLAPKTDK